jgi:rubrerythrin
MAQLESASVDAFRALHADLARLGAPRSLLIAIDAAASDEVRHARMVTRAAERFGARVPRASVPRPVAARSVEQLASENAAEGCVRETFGAAIATMQAERASDPRIRRMMRVIANDELGHAALAWRIGRWFEARLDSEASVRVANTRLGALHRLRAELSAEGPGDEVLGLPDARSLRAVLDAMGKALETGDLTARAA